MLVGIKIYGVCKRIQEAHNAKLQTVSFVCNTEKQPAFGSSSDRRNILCLRGILLSDA